MTRSELANMTTTALYCRADGVRRLIAQAWARGEAGQLSWVYDLALVQTELLIRGEAWRPMQDEAQVRLFDVDRHGDLVDAS